MAAKKKKVDSLEETETLQTDKPKEELKKIKNYKLLEVIGKGGMGTVYLAEQQKPIRRKVALKVIKPGMDSKEIVARFESEQQALALMNHPNIAQVHDSGTTEQGYPYFVMEYVPGVPITEYCDKNKMTAQERLKLFMQVCDAIQHAHFKGVVHRDLKPSNVLVTQQDERHIPKIIDFGIAKALTGQGLTEKTLHTIHGVAIGTPVYMSPEQAELTGYDIDTRTDVYSLGVLLYELLVGVTPLEEKDLEKAGLMEILRIIREKEPPRPSTRFDSLGDTSTEIAKKRGISEIGMSKQLKGDLDWIVMKAIEKDKQRRYNSAAELANDINRYLNQEPIQARPPTIAYKIRKYVRRNKAVSIATISIIFLIIVFSVWNMLERHKAERLLIDSNYNFAVALKEKAKAYAEQNKWQLAKLFAVNSLYYQIKAQKYLSMADINLPLKYQDWILKYDIIISPYIAVNENSTILSPDWKYLASTCNLNGVIKIWEVSSGKEIATLRGHYGEVISMNFSPDEKYLASGSRDKTAKIWEVTSGREIATLRGHERLISALSFSPDSKYLASGSWDATVKIWDVSSGKEIATLKGHEKEVRSVAFSPDGKYLMSRGGGVNIWDMSSGKEIIALKGNERFTASVDFSPDGKYLASGGLDKTIKIWVLSDGKEIFTLRGHKEEIISVTFSPDGKHVVSRSNDKIVKIWDTGSGKENATLKEIKSSVIFSPDGKLVATGKGDRIIKILDISNGKEVITLAGHEEEVLSLNFSPDGEYMASGSRDKTVKIWKVSNGEEIATLVGNEGPVRSVSFSPNGKYLYSANRNRLTIWEASGGKEVTTLKGHDGNIIAMSFSRDGLLLTSGSINKEVKIWNVSSGEEIESFRGSKSEAKSLEISQIQVSYEQIYFSPDWRYVASNNFHSREVKIWEVSSGKEIITIKTSPSSSLDFSPDGKYLALCSPQENTRKNTIKILEVSSGREFATLGTHRVLILIFSPDGRYLASGDDRIKIWEISSGKEISILKENEDLVWSLEFSPDGRYLASAETYKTIIWEVSSGKEITVLKENEEYGRALIFSPDGRYLISGTLFEPIRMWKIPSGKEIANIGTPEDFISSVGFSPDGRLLSIGRRDGKIKIWDVSNEKEIITLRGHQGIVTSSAFSPDGRLLATGSTDIRIWNLDSILNYLWLGLDLPYRIEDAIELIKEVEKQTGFTLDILTPLPQKKMTLGQN